MTWQAVSARPWLMETFDTFGAGEAERNFPFFSSQLSPFLRGGFEALQSFSLGTASSAQSQVQWVTTFDGLGTTQLDVATFLASFEALFEQQMARALGISEEFVSVVSVSTGAPAAFTTTALVVPGGTYATPEAFKLALENDPSVGRCRC